MIYKILLLISLISNDHMKDYNIYCKDWSKIGECHKNPLYMRKMCLYSCTNNLISEIIKNKSKNDISCDLDNIIDKFYYLYIF